MTQDDKQLMEALEAPSFQQDSQWHDGKSSYATKPRALLDQAAARIRQLVEERDDARAATKLYREGLAQHLGGSTLLKQAEDIVADAADMVGAEGFFRRSEDLQLIVQKLASLQRGGSDG